MEQCLFTLLKTVLTVEFDQTMFSIFLLQEITGNMAKCRLISAWDRQCQQVIHWQDAFPFRHGAINHLCVFQSLTQWGLWCHCSSSNTAQRSHKTLNKYSFSSFPFNTKLQSPFIKYILDVRYSSVFIILFYTVLYLYLAVVLFVKIQTITFGNV